MITHSVNSVSQVDRLSLWKKLFFLFLTNHLIRAFHADLHTKLTLQQMVEEVENDFLCSGF